MGDDSSTREDLLEAAKTVLVDPEYEGFTTAAVAEEADRNQALIHYYFDTKRDLVIELFEYLQEEAAEELAAVATEDDPADRLVALLSILLWADPAEPGGPAPAEEAIEFKRGLLWLNAQAAYDPDLREATAADLEHFWDRVEATIREGIERGIFRDVDPAATTALLVAAVDGAQTWGAIYGADARDDLVLDAIETVVTEWLRA